MTQIKKQTDENNILSMYSYRIFYLLKINNILL